MGRLISEKWGKMKEEKWFGLQKVVNALQMGKIETLKSCCYGNLFLRNHNDSHNCCRTNFVLSGFKT